MAGQVNTDDNGTVVAAGAGVAPDVLSPTPLEAIWTDNFDSLIEDVVRESVDATVEATVEHIQARLRRHGNAAAGSASPGGDQYLSDLLAWLRPAGPEFAFSAAHNWTSRHATGADVSPAEMIADFVYPARPELHIMVKTAAETALQSQRTAAKTHARLAYVATLIDDAGQLYTGQRSDGRTTFRLTLSAPTGGCTPAEVDIRVDRIRSGIAPLIGAIPPVRTRGTNCLVTVEGRGAVRRVLEPTVPYLTLRRGAATDMLERIAALEPATCLIDDCGETAALRGVCRRHYARARRAGRIGPPTSGGCALCGAGVAHHGSSAARGPVRASGQPAAGLCPTCATQVARDQRTTPGRAAASVPAVSR